MECQVLHAPTQKAPSLNGRFFHQAGSAIVPLIQQHLPHDHPVLSNGLKKLTDDLSLQLRQPATPFSKLTCQGYPIELAYVWPANSFRFTADLLPGASPQERLNHSLNFVGEFSNTHQIELINLLQGWVEKYEGKYGAWIGARTSADQMQYKLYIEIPENAPWQAWENKIIGQPNQAVKNLRLVMVGLNPESGESEFYYSINSLNRPAVRPLLQRYNMKDRSLEILEMLKSLYQRNIRFEIPSVNMGYSVSFNSKKEAQTFTLYSMAESLLGDDQCIRNKTLSLGARMGWDMNLYEEATQHLIDMEIERLDSWHGMVGIVAANKGPLQFTVGWTPIASQSC